MKLFTNSKKRMVQFSKDNTGGTQEKVASCQATIEIMSRQKINLYAEYKLGHLTKEEYIKKKEELSEQISVLNKKIMVIENNLSKRDESNFIFNSEYAQLVGKFKDARVFSPELADAFIEKVFVDVKHNINYK